MIVGPIFVQAEIESGVMVARHTRPRIESGYVCGGGIDFHTRPTSGTVKLERWFPDASSRYAPAWRLERLQDDEDRGAPRGVVRTKRLAYSARRGRDSSGHRPPARGPVPFRRAEAKSRRNESRGGARTPV